MRRDPETIHIVPDADNHLPNAAPDGHGVAYDMAICRAWNAVVIAAVLAPMVLTGALGSAQQLTGVGTRSLSAQQSLRV